jgi:electron transfer flavoprotein alpha subunit
MAKLLIDIEKCTACGLCVNACAAGALEIADGAARVNDSCVMCGICVGACPAGAITIEKDEPEKPRGAGSGVFLFAEQYGGELAPVAFELCRKGRELADKKNTNLTAMLGGKNARGNAAALIESGADRVIICTDDAAEHNSDEVYAALLTKLIEKNRPEIVLYGATRFGRSLAPRVAARIGTGLTADCTGLEIEADSGLLLQTRPAFGGNLMATIKCPNHRPQMATVRPGVMPASERDKLRGGEIIEESLPENIERKIAVERVAEAGAAATIADARVLVVVGRGIGNTKNLPLAAELAELMGAELGCSRPLVDMGWLEYRHQVGQTGCTVAPELLLSLGVSGAIQHLAGISRAENIIAVNSDPDAPIFDVCDYSVNCDCISFMKELIAELKARQGK